MLITGMMVRALPLLRTVILLIAALAYAMNGAHAGVKKSSDGTLLLPICSVDGTHFISVDIEDKGPAEISDHKCGACLVAAAIVPATCQLPKPIAVFDGQPFAWPVRSRPEQAPIWPGAPPTGPPAIS